MAEMERLGHGRMKTIGLLSKARVLDGGLASELEFLGADISGPLWSAHVLEEEPEKILAVHRAYLEAGAEVLLTASYQVSRMGYLERGLAPERADRGLLRAVELACAAREEFGVKEVLVAASLGPYGAALHNGAEYTGEYGCSYQELVRFHRERIEVLAESGADLIAFETLPSLEEARAIGAALEGWPEMPVWFAFNCPEGRAEQLRVAHGELLRECAELVASYPQTVAVGVNCTQPGWITSLIGELKVGPSRPVVVYPNSGEGWDAERRCWTACLGGVGGPAEYAQLAAQWYAAGAQIVGGCCRTRPEHIQRVAEVAARLATGG